MAYNKKKNKKIKKIYNIISLLITIIDIFNLLFYLITHNIFVNIPFILLLLF